MRSNPRNRPTNSGRKGGLAIVVIVLVAIAAIFGAAIFFKPVSLPIDCNVAIASSPTSIPSKQIQAQIYVDGTPSINGFVAVSGSRYIRTLRTLSTAITEKWQNARIKFYRFGDNNRNLLPSGDFQQAQTSAFYPKDTASESGYAFFENSQITDVINNTDKANNDSLTLIVTDLTENKQNMLNVLEALKQKYINTDFAVGILALRSEFKGLVYDVGLNNESFSWDTNSLQQKNDSKFYRPFYIIILGKYANVNYFYERLEASDKEIIKDSKFIIFDKKVIASPLVLNLKESKPSEEETISSINYGGVSIEPSDQVKDKIQLLRLKPIDKDYKFTYKINGQAALANTVAVFGRDVRYEIEANRFDSSTKKFTPDDAAKDFIKLREVTFSNQETEFEVKFNTSKSADGTYELKASAFLDKLSPLSWMQDWSADEKNWKDGSKTFNASQLFKGLQELVITANSDRPASDKLMAKLCFVAEIH